MSSSNKPEEIEAKIELPLIEDVDRIYNLIGRPEWNLQKNYVYSFEGGLLRIRHENNRAYLTAKGKSLNSEFNKRPEIECEIPVEFYKGFSLLNSSRLVGSPRYYEKLRASRNFGDCTVCLDNLDGSYFVEIEGDEDEIRRYISQFGLEKYPIEKRNYVQIIGEKNDKKNSH